MERGLRNELEANFYQGGGAKAIQSIQFVHS
jgi:hypothetical protein